MDLDQRDIEKGALPGILPRFYPNCIPYLSELNDYRMYAEVWSNKKSKENAKRMEIGHAGYMQTLEFGERNQKRQSDKVRFDYFEVSTNSIMNSSYSQRVLLMHIYGEEAFSERMQLLYKVERKYIRCLFEDPAIFERNRSMSNTISRLCVAWPFFETIVFDFAGTLEDYCDACLFGTLINEKEEKVERNEKATEDQTEDEGWLDGPGIDSYI